MSGHHSSLLLVGSSIFYPENLLQKTNSFARPGVAPVEYTDGARVEMKVNKPSSQIQFFVASVVYTIFVGSTDCMKTEI